MEIWLKPKPPFSNELIPIIWSKLKLRLLKFCPFRIRLELILILLTFNVFVSKSNLKSLKLLIKLLPFPINISPLLK